MIIYLVVVCYMGSSCERPFMEETCRTWLAFSRLQVNRFCFAKENRIDPLNQTLANLGQTKQPRSTHSQISCEFNYNRGQFDTNKNIRDELVTERRYSFFICCDVFLSESPA